MEVEVNYLAVFLAMLSSMVVGSVWYSPKVFGDMWMKLAKINTTGNKADVWKPIAVTAVVSFVTAYVLAHVTYLSFSFFHNDFMSAALTTAFWTWLGFTAARFITHDAFEGRRKKLTLLNISHELVTFMLMGLVIGWLGV